VLLLVIGFVLGALTVSAEKAPAAAWECPAGHTCHVLLGEGAEVYVLTADGRVRLDVFGADSALVSNRP
jgi:hypothetical protein